MTITTFITRSWKKRKKVRAWKNYVLEPLLSSLMSKMHFKTQVKYPKKGSTWPSWTKANSSLKGLLINPKFQQLGSVTWSY